MTKRLEIRLPKKLFDKLENYKKENNYLDIQDIIYELLRGKFHIKKTFFRKLKNLFK